MMRIEHWVCGAAIVVVLSIRTTPGEVIPVRGEPPGRIQKEITSGKTAGGFAQVYGLDSKTGEVTWIFLRRQEVNFMHVFPEGALMGFDDGTLVLLDIQTGKTKWDVRIGKTTNRVNTFQGRYDEGYLVSENDHPLWFVSRDGKLLWTRK